MSNARDKANIPALNFSSTGIDDNATSTAITIDSNQRVGFGTASPSGITEFKTTADTNVFITAGNANSSQLVLGDTDDIDVGKIRYRHTNNAMEFTVNASERMRIDSSGNVGIGTSSPESIFHVLSTAMDMRLQRSTAVGNNSTHSSLNFKNADTIFAGIASLNKSGSTKSTGADGYEFRLSNQGNGYTSFFNNGSESMRINSSGEFFIGKTTTGVNNVGIEARPIGLFAVARDSANAGYFTRRTNDGNILQLYKDTTMVGSIGTQGGDLVIHSSASGHTGFRFLNAGAFPTNNAGSLTDNSMDLGGPGNRFDDIYATNGTIQTSDQNEKQSIQSLTTAEMNVAKRLSPLIKTFKWNSSVEEKGASARTHTGIIAQDVQQAFTDEGLDASNYALFISSTWWQKEISVEATEEKDAYTYIDIKEEATEGYTERTRLGVRYPELLSFIQAYNDQRFTELEARITALETNNP